MSECGVMASTGARKIVKKMLSVEQAEGEGARVRRSVGRPEVINIIMILYLAHHHKSRQKPTLASKAGPVPDAGRVQSAQTSRIPGPSPSRI